ncbi:shikimate dehydrogenase [Priestia aryabhattai]|uniref:shikimate dehydrogenase family protein n=1 Tax=Priestia TaxID=2800373 RepID=UPI002041A9FA|nr:shikimate dehydrogenase [Priestia aryabhattai]MCM2977669.1 shikimate dehydrogenase [Priestia aryabhattai]MED3959537.1 shikimate dehydrogenase [Priestia aryabhattai]
MLNLVNATKPTFYFIGVTTGQSSIMKLFPLWAKSLCIDAEIKGIDIDIHASGEVYREVVTFLKNDPLSLGALVTTHKIDLYHAAKDLFDELDPYALLFGELSSISKRDGKLIGHAKDHISSGLAMEGFLPKGYWNKHKGDVLIMGAGGSAIAIASNLIHDAKRNGMPSAIYVTNRSQPRLDSMQKIISEMSTDVPIQYLTVDEPSKNDKVLSKLKPYSLVINATGLGKDRPGSPLSNEALFPHNSLVWELNYRGDLLFMQQALSQKETQSLYVEDGWIYFIHGWTQVISEVFQIQLSNEQFTEIERISSEFNQSKVSGK